MAAQAHAMLKREIAQRIREVRTQKGLTQEECAKTAELSVSGLRNLEAGRAIPGGDTLVYLAYAFGCRVEDLLPEDYSPFVSETATWFVARRSNATIKRGAAVSRRKQDVKKSARRRREGGFPAPAARRAAMLAEVA